ncbi:auxin-responsive protein SAUR77-like [Bidens hawaiensis]|uniref:auxin-responsive protein SAUR77-like n=1 Tax=Bidens hawaiensis TaxID=980011 RepID=UPI0040498C7B
MKKISHMLPKFMTLISKSSSSTTTTTTDGPADAGEESQITVFVGSTKRPYMIDSKYLSHPVVNALIQKSISVGDEDDDGALVIIKCEVVLFDHLLWMLDNSDLNLGSDSVDELADLYLII